MNSKSEQLTRKLLLSFLQGRNAHLNLEDVLTDFPKEHMNSKIAGVEYSPWQLLEHIRLTQKDIIQFLTNPDYEMPKWPEGYWPAIKEGDVNTWDESLSALMEDLSVLEDMVRDYDKDLYSPMPAGEKYTLLREILVVIDHNAHHLGQMIMFRKHFDGDWKK